MKQLREAWGCEDGGAAAPYAYLTCWRCGGSSTECDLCHGESRGAPVARCPYRHIHAAIWSVLDSFDQLQHGVLPVAGGALDQSNTWGEAMRLIRSEFAKHHEAAMKEASDDIN